MNVELKDLSTIIAAFITSGAFYGGIKFFFQRRADSGAIVVKTAEGVVLMQSAIIKELKDENQKLHAEIRNLWDKVRKLEGALDDQLALTSECQRHIADLEKPK